MRGPEQIICIRDYQAGKLSDSKLMEAQKLLERWVQDAKHGLISKEKGQEAQQLLDRIAGTDVNASKGDYVIEKEINDGMRMILVAVVHLTKQSVKEKV